MSRLIDADAFLADESEAFMAAQLKVKDEATRLVNEVVHKKIQMLIADAPTIDVEPVIHGHWIEEDGYQICSNCGEEHAWAEYRASYCDVCGAKMDEVSE